MNEFNFNLIVTNINPTAEKKQKNLGICQQDFSKIFC